METALQKQPTTKGLLPSLRLWSTRLAILQSLASQHLGSEEVVMALFAARWPAGLFAAGISQSLRAKIIASTWCLFIENFTHVSLSTLLLTEWLGHHPQAPLLQLLLFPVP